MTSEKFIELEAAFREHGSGACTKVAETCGIAVNTARKAWFKGWPELGLPSIAQRFGVHIYNASTIDELRKDNPHASGEASLAHAREVEAQRLAAEQGSTPSTYIAKSSDHTATFAVKTFQGDNVDKEHTQSDHTSSDHTSRDHTPSVASHSAGSSPSGVLQQPGSPPGVIATRVIPAGKPDGWTDQQWSARQKEPAAILANQAAGLGVVAIGTRILKKMEDQLEATMARLVENEAGEGEPLNPKEFVAMFEKVAKILTSVAPTLAPLMAAQRLSVGQPQTLTAHAHAHAHQHSLTPSAPGAEGVPAPEPVSQDERAAKLRRLALAHLRLSTPVAYEGAETGIADEEEPEESDE